MMGLGKEVKMNRLFISILVSCVFLALTSFSLYASDLEAGKAFFAKKRCGMCHIIEGKGGKIGTDLSHVGSKRDSAWLRDFMENPKKVIPGAKMMPVRGSDAELAALTSYLLSHK